MAPSTSDSTIICLFTFFLIQSRVRRVHFVILSTKSMLHYFCQVLLLSINIVNKQINGYTTNMINFNET